MNKTRLLIWGIASVTAGTALYVVLPRHWKSWWSMFLLWSQEGNPFPVWLLSVWIIFDLILLLKLIASYGLFNFRFWGRTLATYVLSADFLFRLTGFTNVQTYYWRHPEMVQRHKEMLESMLSQGAVRQTTISFIPGYIIGLLSLISVIILIMRPVRQGFGGIAIKADKSGGA
jgi:hypothetical protein